MAAAEATVLKLMQRDNKPFGLQTLVDLLAHQGLKKAAISKALDALAESGKVVSKASEAQAQHAQQGAPTLNGTRTCSRTGTSAKLHGIQAHVCVARILQCNCAWPRLHATSWAIVRLRCLSAELLLLQEFGKTKVFIPTQSDLAVLSKEVRLACGPRGGVGEEQESDRCNAAGTGHGHRVFV